jgi:transcriptional regulator with XRE-family HTH domain
VPKTEQSRKRDVTVESSLISDSTSLAEVLRATRLSRQLSQVELAKKLGLRQRQISDLERATTDPRLSTIHNVARALDLELMLIPRPLISVVNALQRSGADADKRPLYSLGDEDTPADAPAQPEVGDGSESSSPSARQFRRHAKGQP